MSRKTVTFLCLLAAITLVLAGCGGRHGHRGDEDLAPLLFQDTLGISPEPAQLYEDVEFYFGFEDFDGDMENATVICLLINDAGERFVVEPTQIQVNGSTEGSIVFNLEIRDGFQGEYYIVVEDEAGNPSNEISRYLNINTVPAEDQDEEYY